MFAFIGGFVLGAVVLLGVLLLAIFGAFGCDDDIDGGDEFEDQPDL
jgi:hypothetical protein